MSDKFRLAKELAAAAEPCFDSADRLAVYTEMSLGAQQNAIDDIIGAVLRKDYPIPGALIDELSEWLATEPIDGHDDDPHDLAQRLARVRTT